MSQRPWIFFTNPFLQVLEDRGFSQTVTLSIFHDSKLSAATDPAVMALYNAYHPFHLALVTAYDNWKLHKGIQKGSTAGATQTRQQITAKVNEWDRGIQQVFLPGTPQYIGIFPNGHKPFLSGKQQDIITAVANLIGALANNPDLTPVRQSVEAYYNVLLGTNNAKNMAKGTTDQYAAALETVCEAACKTMFINLGKMYALFIDNLEAAAEYFDMTILRDEAQTVFTKQVEAGDIYSIAKRKLKPLAQIRIRNTGNTELYFYLAPGRDHDHTPAGFYIAAPESEQVVSAQQLDYAPQNTWLTVHNQTMGEGSFELTVL